MPVCQAKRSCTIREYAQWVAFYGFEPWGEERADLRAGIIAATVANAFGGGKAKPQDYMPNFDRRIKRQTVQEQQAVMSRTFAALKKRKQRGNKHS